MTSKKGQIKNPFQHALLRPETYIGKINTFKKVLWVKKSQDESQDQIVEKNVYFNGGLFRIIVEILSNAIDNKYRSEKENIDMKKIQINFDIDKESPTYGWVTIINDGYWIPVEETEYEIVNNRTGKTDILKMYPAEAFFGEMLAGTNFDDDEKDRKTSGRNGMGAKATNIFSQEFHVEHSDPENKKILKITFSEHGMKRSEVKIKKYSKPIGYTKISFLPDYEYFGYTGHKKLIHLYSIISRLACECSMLTGINTFLNGKKIVVKNLVKYSQLYSVEKRKFVNLKTSLNDEIIIVETNDDGVSKMDMAKSISFVNGLVTMDGGIHVNTFCKYIFSRLVKLYNEKSKTNKTTITQVYPYFMVFVKCEVACPRFDSQTKDELSSFENGKTVLPLYNASSKKEWDAAVNSAITKIMKWDCITMLRDKLDGIIDEALTSKENKKTNKRVLQGNKFTDANLAKNPRHSEKCILSITEGLSAKTVADNITENEPKGRDYHGSFAVQGKFINVNGLSKKAIDANKEVRQIKEALNLKYGVDYTIPENKATLRYGKIRILTDGDDDGIHIRGLLIGFFLKWPSLFQLNMIECLSTRVVSVTFPKTKTKPRHEICFYSNPEFKEWQSQNSHLLTGKVDVKYFKGLGSHKLGEEKLYVTDPKLVTYKYSGKEQKYVQLGFNEKFVQKRKTWITDAIEEARIAEPAYITEGNLSIKSFILKQLVIYHRITLKRCLPCIWDGLKDAQRKALYGILNSLYGSQGRKELVALTGEIKSITNYHHGDESLQQAVIKMGQGFVGGNNIPYIVEDGQFGTRKEQGKDHSHARYLQTSLEDIIKKIFINLDNPILTHNYDNGKPIEYSFYIPIVPMLLVNGSKGMACGFSTTIYKYNIIDIIAWIIEWIKLNPILKKDSNTDYFLNPDNFNIVDRDLIPWYRGFTGKIIPKEGGFTFCGNVEEGKNNTFIINEIPPDISTNSVKDYLEKIIIGKDDKGKDVKFGKSIKSYNEYNTVNTVKFVVTVKKGVELSTEKGGIMSMLVQDRSTRNMYALDENDYPTKYDTAKDILHAFCIKRMEYYILRKKYWLKFKKEQLIIEKNRYKFVQLVVNKELDMHQSDTDLEKQMLEFGLVKIKDTFDYLLSMQMRSMTVTKVQALKKEVDKLVNEFKIYKATTPSQMWINELQDLEKAYDKFLSDRIEIEQVCDTVSKKKITKRKQV